MRRDVGIGRAAGGSGREAGRAWDDWTPDAGRAVPQGTSGGEVPGRHPIDGSLMEERLEFLDEGALRCRSSDIEKRRTAIAHVPPSALRLACATVDRPPRVAHPTPTRTRET